MSLSHHIFEPSQDGSYEVAILIKENSFNMEEIEKYYVTPMVTKGIARNKIIVMSLTYNDNNKAPVRLIKESLSNVLKACKSINVTTLFVADTNYFKVLTKERKSEPHYGYVLPCKIDSYEYMNVILSLNYAALFHDPTQLNKITRSIETVVAKLTSVYIEPGQDVIRYSRYPSELKDIRKELKKLHKHPALTIDIETYSLETHKAKIATIAFAWNKHKGIAFNVVNKENNKKYNAYKAKIHEIIYRELKEFFIKYKGTCIYHGATFDVKILIYYLFMGGNYTNRIGMLEGLDVMFKDTHCTKIITYLATNSTAGNDLKLKNNAAEFAGNYAEEDIKDITKIKARKLLKYNLIDCLSTWFVYEKYYPILIQDNQDVVYETIQRPSLRTIVETELIGLPMNVDKVFKLKLKLKRDIHAAASNLNNTPTIHSFRDRLQLEATIAKNSKLKVKRVTVEDFKDLGFNPNSNKQVGKLLHEHLDLPIIATTDTGAPSVGGDVLKEHLTTLMNKHNLTDEDLK